ncbi:N-acetylglucosamine-6-phosphate deacetylase [Gorillibacterium timonense]|uniref:N-acetylglucosamine-6-phosphate deacetylase n=1 Tax=Gorillibacterium timonense TaxID=1689269 RepID=UPI00071DF75D|nr:N-acetylglucosamine-6-phosphate deacetylase [Gorillibacterium timonense]
MTTRTANEFRIVHARIVTPNGIVEDGSLLVRDGRIAEITSGTPSGGQDGIPSIDAAGAWLLPGFVDVHVHGGGGSDFMDATKEAFDTITALHGRNGTTSMLATTVTGSKESQDRVLAAVKEYREQPMPYAQLVGVHLEGPFINKKMKGAQNPDYIVPPQKEWLEDWLGSYPGEVKIQTLAPESEGALPYIGQLVTGGVVAAAGHTDATYDQVEAAADAGLTHAVHCYNAMRGLHHREPGTLGAVLTDDRIIAEVIADGHHVHAAGVKLLFRQKGADKVILVTDAISAAGLDDGDYALGGLPVLVEGGVARLKENGALAGSTLTMIGAFRFAVTQAGASIEEASRMASGNPSRQIGIDAETGTLEPGKQADLLLLSADLTLEQVWVKGRPLD